jgi:hypothetical protein
VVHISSTSRASTRHWRRRQQVHSHPVPPLLPVHSSHRWAVAACTRPFQHTTCQRAPAGAHHHQRRV